MGGPRDPPLEKKPTYDELLGEVSKDFLLKLPKRTSLDILNSFEMSKLKANFEELGEIQRKRNEHAALQLKVDDAASQAGVGRRHLGAIVEGMGGPAPEPAGACEAAALGHLAAAGPVPPDLGHFRARSPRGVARRRGRGRGTLRS